MREKSRSELDRADALIGKLDGIQAKLEVMAAAYQANGEIPSPALTEAALTSVAEEVREAAAAFRELRAVPEKEGREMTDQEIRNGWTIIRRADFSGQLQPCARCGGEAQVFVVDPVGTWLRSVMPATTVFLAARCACGTTGKLSTTGMNVVTGNFVDELRAAEIAAKNWNAQQEG